MTALLVEAAVSAPTGSTDFVGEAEEVCGGMTVADALLSARLMLQPSAAEQVGSLLGAAGFHTALDLQLVGVSGVKREAEELMDFLTQHRVSIADRSKVRLLMDGKGRPYMSIGGTRPQEIFQTSRLSRRQLQNSNGGDSLSMDTLAIVLSVLVGAFGYLIQSYTARRGEAATAKLAHEQRESDATKQRLHQQMLAQIMRTDRWLDDCCRPIKVALDSLSWLRFQFVSGAVEVLSMSAPETVEHMLEQCAKIYTVSADRTQSVSMRDESLFWELSKRGTELTMAVSDGKLGFDSAAASAIAMSDLKLSSSQPFCLELPNVLHESLADDATSLLSHRFRSYAKHSFVPGLRRVANLLEEHSAVVPTPPTAWFVEKFPGEPWYAISPLHYRVLWLARTLAWEAIIAEWEVGEHRSILPPGGCYFPFHGMQATNDFAITAGEALQQELIGATHFFFVAPLQQFRLCPSNRSKAPHLAVFRRHDCEDRAS
eukprot:SAG31_NODE_718_length_12607_cov_21.723937_1_plen_486_part_00